MEHGRAGRHALIALAIAVGVAGAGSGAGAGTTEPRSVVATARAQGVRATYTMPDYVVVSEFFDGGGPVTEAVADSTGRATSFSSLPWPGENAVTAPGTLSVALGQSVPLAYPFFVQADHPTAPSAEFGDPSGSYQLQAAAAVGTASGLAHLTGGGRASDSRATSSVVLDDGGIVRVVAESVDTGISVGDGVLRIASVRSRSETTLSPDAPAPVTTTELVIEGAAVAGQPVVIDGSGVHAAGQSVAAPVGAGFSSQTDVLRQAGITAEIVPTAVTGGADALVITSRQQFPAPGNPEGSLVLRFGAAATELVVGNAEGVALGGDDVVVSDPPAGRAAAEEVPVVTTTTLAGRPEVPEEGPPVLPSVEGFWGAEPEKRTPPLDTPAAGGPVSSALARPRPAGNAAPVPELATTGALPSILAVGGLAVVAVTRMHRWKTRRSFG